MSRLRRTWLVAASLFLVGCQPASSPTVSQQSTEPTAPHTPAAEDPAMQENETAFLGLRTVSFHVPDLATAKDWYAQVLGVAPYFDQPFYVGFNVGGFELGLQPWEEDRPREPGGASSVVAYWGVPKIEPTLAKLVQAGAQLRDPIQDVGDGIQVASVVDPFGNVLGIIENPHFPNRAEPNTVTPSAADSDK